MRRAGFMRRAWSLLIAVTSVSGGCPFLGGHKMNCSRSRLRIWSRETGSTVPSCASLLILSTQAESGVPTSGILSILSFSATKSISTVKPQSGQSRFYQATQLCIDGVYHREFTGTAPESLKDDVAIGVDRRFSRERENPRHGDSGLFREETRAAPVRRPDFSAATYRALRDDIIAMFTESRDFWPADFGSYAPFLVRLAWHCSGGYRSSDGRGGCGGGRIRFNPERSWADNTNLDKALEVLQPIKLEYGDAVSWGDLIVLAGSMAIQSMGGPFLGFCAGRRDDYSGFASLELGPTEEQKAVAPCKVNGTCVSPVGTSTIGLIYVNPAGPMGEPHPEGSVSNIRDVFDRMTLNDSETVALIGGGHTFGKFHGACPTGPGPDPNDAPEAPWPGTCGDPDSPTFGRGENTFTAGFEGQWTVEPTVWDNAYFRDLLTYDWEVEQSPGGNPQWAPVLKADTAATDAEVPNIRMLTTDIALIKDPDYLELVELFASDMEALEVSFSNAWYKLTTRDMGPYSRCAGTDIPPPQEFQLPLPDPPATPSHHYREASQAIQKILFSTQPSVEPDVFEGRPSYAALFVTLAYQCASTFRGTDYMGGCNGARIRFSPQQDWADNVGMDSVLKLLEPVKEAYPDISYADLIVMAGNTALEEGACLDLSFCEGRVDATEGADQIAVLEPREYGDVIVGARDRMKIAGLSVPQFVALAGRPRSPSQMIRLGYSGSYTRDPTTVSNALFRALVMERWEKVEGSGGAEYRAMGSPGVYALATDLALVWDDDFRAHVVVYAEDNDLFLEEFASAWTAIMNADRFDGPLDNLCDGAQPRIAASRT